MDDVFWVMLAFVFSFIGNIIELWILSSFIAKKTTKTTIEGINLWLASEGSKEAIEGLLTHIQNSPKASEIANNLGMGIVNGASESVVARLKGTIGGLRKGINAAEDQLAQEALAQQSPILSLATQALEGKKKRKGGINVSDIIKTYAQQQMEKQQTKANSIPSGGNGW